MNVKKKKNSEGKDEDFWRYHHLFRWCSKHRFEGTKRCGERKDVFGHQLDLDGSIGITKETPSPSDRLKSRDLRCMSDAK